MHLRSRRVFNWEQIRDRFQTSNPTLRAAQISIDESRAQEITAYLRPNPDLTASVDQINPFSTQTLPNGGSGAYAPFRLRVPIEFDQLSARAAAQAGIAAGERTEGDRDHRRAVRRSGANLLFNLRTAFVQTLQQKAILDLTRENLAYYNRLLAVSNDRLKAGDIAKVDLPAAGAAARAV